MDYKFLTYAVGGMTGQFYVSRFRWIGVPAGREASVERTRSVTAVQQLPCTPRPLATDKNEMFWRGMLKPTDTVYWLSHLATNRDCVILQSLHTDAEQEQQVTYQKQTMFIWHSVLLLSCSHSSWPVYCYVPRYIFCTFTLALSEVCVQCP